MLIYRISASVYCIKCLIRRNGVYTKTLNNPRFPFSMYPKCIDFGVINSRWNAFYDRQLINSGRCKFILHDGPPYANGELHAGHALNKVLKDVHLRFKLLSGHSIEYIPGWDCHGLPIELKAIENSNISSANEIRRAASSLAQKFIGIQKNSFQEWGVIGSWNGCYHTMDKRFQAVELKAFLDLHSKGFIFRSSLPVYWSTDTKSAIAESELEYNPEHKSYSIYLKVKLTKYSFRLGKNVDKGSNVYGIVWTTNPWTVFSNEAIAYDSSATYILLQSQPSGDIYLVGKYFSDRLKSFLPGERIHQVDEILGDNLNGCFYSHPTRPFAYEIPFLSSPHVCKSMGTGLVHIAPCHGKEDFELAKKHNLPLKLFVDESGCFTPEVGSELLTGQEVLRQGNTSAIELLKPIIVHKEVVSHSYPYDWRTKKPVIIRLSDQWFIDTKKISPSAVEEYKKVNVIPASHKHSMLPFISERPSWCISRQRVWGVPIPVLFKINDKSPIIDYDLIDHIASRVASEGSDFWFSETLDQLVPEYFWKKWGITSDDVYKSTEVFDVWFDSGLSWLCVLNSGNYSHQPGSYIIADTYLEGHDQFRGWFSASLLLSVALTGYAPFKDLIVHGFVADSQGCKMSKSLGNGITPKELIANENGCIDIMRRWVCSSGLDSVCRLGSKEMKQNNTGYKALRNSLRFMLGNLYDFCPITQIKHTLDLNSMDTSYSLSRLVLEMINSVQENNDNSYLGGMDKSVLYSLGNIVSTSLNIYYPQFRYDTILAEIDQFLSHFSSVYITSVKDRLYFNHPDDPFRRNTQIVFWLTVECLKAILAPILPYLMEEIEIVTWNYLSSNWMILKHQYETLLERYSSLTLHDYYCVDEWKICSDWLLCLSAMQQWNEFKIYSTYVNKASLLFHSLINTLSKDRDALPSSNNSLSVCHVHINIPTKDHDMYCMLKALHPLESVKSISSDLCYLLRAASVSWSCGLYPNEFLNATRYYNFPLNDAFVSIKFLSEDEGIRCHRCHRYSLKDSSKNLCYRCTKVLNTSILVKTSSESL